MDVKTILVSAGVALLVVVLGSAYFGPQKVIEKKTEKLGAIPGNELQSDEFIISGLSLFTRKMSLITGATTTPCVLQSPNNTTTLLAFQVNLNTATGTAKTVILAKGAAMQASTTVLGSHAWAASTAGTFYSTSTPSGVAVLAPVIAPTNWLNVSLVGGNGADAFQTGSCSALFLGQ